MGLHQENSIHHFVLTKKYFCPTKRVIFLSWMWADDQSLNTNCHLVRIFAFLERWRVRTSVCLAQSEQTNTLPPTQSLFLVTIHEYLRSGRHSSGKASYRETQSLGSNLAIWVLIFSFPQKIKTSSDGIEENPNVEFRIPKFILCNVLGSGGGSVGRAVAPDTRDPRFEFQHRQSFIYQL